MSTRYLNNFISWFDSKQGPSDHVIAEASKLKIARQDMVRCIPYAMMHLTCFAVIWVGVSPIALVVAGFAYFLRMFTITAFYHRYFSHRAFETSRVLQFIFAVIGSASVQRGPLWWAAHHRFHHRHSDTEVDPHSPKHTGFLWSHCLWFVSAANFPIREALVRDWAKYPEIRFLDRFDILIPIIYAVCCFSFGKYLEIYFPEFGTTGWQMLVWGFFVSTIILYHCTFTINSLAHVWGRRRYPTNDDSRNNFFLALITLGEGWHNNHHFAPTSARQGFCWWEIDITYYILLGMKQLGLVWNLAPIPAKAWRSER